MKLSDDRLAASDLTPEDLRLLEQISQEVFGGGRPALVGRGGEIPLPEPVFDLLVRIVQALRQGESVVLMPETEPMTTQAAANFLGVSRPFLIKLLEENQIPFHLVGTHRRVLLKDLRAFQKRRDTERRAALKNLFDEIDEAGLYDKVDPDNQDAR